MDNRTKERKQSVSESPVIEETARAESSEPVRTSGSEKNSLAVPLAIIFAGALIAGAIILTDRPSSGVAAQPGVPDARAGVEGADIREAPKETFAVKADDHVLGNPDAPLLLIEYTDFECPFCMRFHGTMKQVMESYGKNGEVAWIIRHFPLAAIHPNAQKYAEGSECANELGGNDAFWKFQDELFAMMEKNTPAGVSGLPAIAEGLGLSRSAFQSCLNGGKYATRVQRDFEEGVKAGVKGTPFSIIYNRKTGKQVPINGAYPYDNVKALIESAR